MGSGLIYSCKISGVAYMLSYVINKVLKAKAPSIMSRQDKSGMFWEQNYESKAYLLDQMLLYFLK